jgi:hypothetical protein
MNSGKHPDDCGCSTGIHEGITFGRGRLDFNGFWEFPCRPCAVAWDKAHPDDSHGPAWPYDDGPYEPVDEARFPFSR